MITVYRDVLKPRPDKAMKWNKTSLPNIYSTIRVYPDLAKNYDDNLATSFDGKLVFEK